MKYISSFQMKRLDRRAADQFGISTLMLMENAGRGIADLAEDFLCHCERPKGAKAGTPAPALNRNPLTVPSQDGTKQSRRLLCRFAPRNESKRILVVCGKGGNGGDGFVAARHLSNRGYRVKVVILAPPDELKGDPKVNYGILKKMGVPIERVVPNRPYKRLAVLIRQSDLIIDAIFGMGLDRQVTGIAREVISILNGAGRKILSIDIPSGLNGDTGAVMGAAVKATVTGTLALPKKGMRNKGAKKYLGKIEVLDISIPKQLL